MHLYYPFWTIWGNTNVELKNSVVKFQKRAARSILDKPIDTPSHKMFSKLKWMTFPEGVNCQKAVLMYKIMHNRSAPYLQDLFQFTHELYNRNLRSTSENLLYISQPSYEIYRNTLAYSGSKIWSSIPENIELASSLLQFKERMASKSILKKVSALLLYICFAFVYCQGLHNYAYMLSIIILPAYKVCRGYIVLVFSITMFVSVCVWYKHWVQSLISCKKESVSYCLSFYLFVNFSFSPIKYFIKDISKSYFT